MTKKEDAVQNIPVSTPLGRAIRTARFHRPIVEPELDYSELELRLLAQYIREVAG